MVCGLAAANQGVRELDIGLLSSKRCLAFWFLQSTVFPYCYWAVYGKKERMASGQDGTSGKCPSNPTASRLLVILWFVRESETPKIKPSILFVKHAVSEMLFRLRKEKTFFPGFDFEGENLIKSGRAKFLQKQKVKIRGKSRQQQKTVGGYCWLVYVNKTKS